MDKKFDQIFSQLDKFMRLKSEVHWIQHIDGYWILRNPEYLTFLQVNNTDKNIEYIINVSVPKMSKLLNNNYI